jgi:hypothetical protein
LHYCGGVKEILMEKERISIAELEKILADRPAPEELDPELKETLFTSSSMEFIGHPLIHDMYFEMENHRYNTQLKMKKQHVQDCFDRKAWHQYIFIHERPYRLFAFKTIERYLENKEYWELLHSIWIDSENIYQNKKDWKKLLTSNRKHKECFMDKKDRIFFKSLPDEIVVYRGYIRGENLKGFSYTLSKDVALFFSNRFKTGKGNIVEKVVKTRDVFAYLGGRNEEEVIILVEV